jgi:aspartate/methionine/tyrosine aminotransferase
VGEIAAKVGVRVLVDEVYLETLFDQPWQSAFHLGPNFIITGSLTKAYGLSVIRCGWILAQPDLVQRMWQIVDFTYGSPVHPAARLGVIALDNLDRIRNRAARSWRRIVHWSMRSLPTIRNLIVSLAGSVQLCSRD